MRILITTATYYPDVNGASYTVQRLAFNLQKQGHTVMVLASSPGYRQQSFEHNGGMVYGLPSLPIERIRFPTPMLINHWVTKAIKEFRPDVIHVATHFAPGRNAAAIGKKLGIPVVGTNHFMPENLVHYMHLPKRLESFVIASAWKHCLWTMGRINDVTSPTQIAANLLTNVGLKKPVRVVSNGIDLEIFHASRKNGEDLYTRYGIPNDQPILLSVCRLDKEKNVDLIIRAFAKASQKISATLVIAGNGAERKNLEKLVDVLGLRKRIVFSGFVPDADLPQLYAMSDVFIIAGTAELQCLVAMEAMASGLPVLAVRAMALPELVKNRVNGMLFEHGDTDTMAAQMVEIFSDSDLRAILGHGALVEIQKHDMAQVIDAFEQIYKRVLA